MKAAGAPKRGLLIRIIVLAVIGYGLFLAWQAYRQDRDFPYSDDASLDAEVVHVAASVGGRLLNLPVHENQAVRAGDLLFELDPVPYRLAVEQAKADLDLAKAALATRRRVITTETAAANIAKEQTTRAKTNYELAVRTAERLAPLAAKNFVPKQQYDNAEVVRRDAATSLSQAQRQEAAAIAAIGDTSGEEAAIRAREAALAIAERALENTIMRAPHAGRIAGLKVTTGEFIAPAQSLFTLITTDEWFLIANFRESQLPVIKVGDCVTGYSMIDRTKPLHGRVQGIGWGVLEASGPILPRQLPFVQRSLNWVRVAQRFPVRVHLEEPPEELMRIGASASAQIRYGAACQGQENEGNDAAAHS
ncbi:multidrug transporter subunit MdtN [Beijerinckia indica]|uniref:Secretion protein HlyD family protein n=1 Tax=Beijerinckia indica subsp. indica (strain ATCC 9039 / DSM 1715 / NCIMB 8712) TaxID=395963 RepID=B2ICG2_BEII9|nr:multidrug transporter subunit MdtN [Beijerinckia indica]ACB93851.1 secretion protein HlyD family protein [Beijerinckia indica subsp. indica ATCC 9039]